MNRGTDCVALLKLHTKLQACGPTAETAGRVDFVENNSGIRQFFGNLGRPFVVVAVITAREAEKKPVPGINGPSLEHIVHVQLAVDDILGRDRIPFLPIVDHGGGKLVEEGDHGNGRHVESQVTESLSVRSGLSVERNQIVRKTAPEGNLPGVLPDQPEQHVGNDVFVRIILDRSLKVFDPEHPSPGGTPLDHIPFVGCGIGETAPVEGVERIGDERGHAPRIIGLAGAFDIPPVPERYSHFIVNRPAEVEILQLNGIARGEIVKGESRVGVPLVTSDSLVPTQSKVAVPDLDADSLVHAAQELG